MTGFEEFCADVREAAGRHRSGGVPPRVECRDHDMLRAFGAGASPLARARDGLEEVAEFARTSAEHHPYWGLLYSCSEAAYAVLERWDGTLTDDELAGIEWEAKRLARAASELRRAGRG